MVRTFQSGTGEVASYDGDGSADAAWALGFVQAVLAVSVAGV